MRHPNILMIVCHDLGRYLSCYGRAPLHTPHLDRLAAEGARFSHCFCTAPSCSPSRGSIITGRYPHSNGLMGLVNNGWELPLSEGTLPGYLRQAGYRTALFGIQHERTRAHAPSLGYDHIFGWGTGVGKTALEMAASVSSYLADGLEEPFYINMGPFEPHRPFAADPEGAPADVCLPPYLPDHPVVRREMAGFSRLVSRLDAGVGRVLAALDGSGLSERTLVVFTTDHGIDMPRAKGTLYDPGLETALLMRLPGVVRAGTVHHELLGNVDLLPTILEAAGCPVPEEVQGRGFYPLLTGDAYQPRRAIFGEKTHHCHYDPMRCIRTQDHKYIVNFGQWRQIEIPADVEMNCLAAVPDLLRERRPGAELYDLRTDPLEQCNLAGQPDSEELEESLRGRLRRWMADTGDPLLDGSMPIPVFL